MEGPEIKFAEAVLDNGKFGTRTIRFETGRLAQQAQPDVPVVMYAENVNPLMARRCLELGAAGYALKGADPLDLICAIEAALGHRHLHRHLRSQAAAGIPAAGRAAGGGGCPLGVAGA